MITLLRTTLLALSLVFLSSCSGISTKSTYSKDVDFSTLKGYAWEAHSTRYTDPRLNNPALRARIVNSVESELLEHGFEKVDSSAADFLVRYDVRIEQRGKLSNLATDSDREDGTGVFLSEQTVPHLSEKNQGSLVLDFVQPDQGHVLWSGTARAVVDLDASDSKKDARVLKAVQKLFKKLPQSKG